jgi:hypothetical protein
MAYTRTFHASICPYLKGRWNECAFCAGWNELERAYALPNSTRFIERYEKHIQACLDIWNPAIESGDLTLPEDAIHDFRRLTANPEFSEKFKLADGKVSGQKEATRVSGANEWKEIEILSSSAKDGASEKPTTQFSVAQEQTATIFPAVLKISIPDSQKSSEREEELLKLLAAKEAAFLAVQREMEHRERDLRKEAVQRVESVRQEARERVERLHQEAEEVRRRAAAEKQEEEREQAALRRAAEDSERRAKLEKEQLQSQADFREKALRQEVTDEEQRVALKVARQEEVLREEVAKMRERAEVAELHQETTRKDAMEVRLRAAREQLKAEREQQALRQEAAEERRRAEIEKEQIRQEAEKREVEVEEHERALQLALQQQKEEADSVRLDARKREEVLRHQLKKKNQLFDVISELKSLEFPNFSEKSVESQPISQELDLSKEGKEAVGLEKISIFDVLGSWFPTKIELKIGKKKYNVIAGCKVIDFIKKKVATRSDTGIFPWVPWDYSEDSGRRPGAVKESEERYETTPWVPWNFTIVRMSVMKEVNPPDYYPP